jgi:hypothetical protein
MRRTSDARAMSWDFHATDAAELAAITPLDAVERRQVDAARAEPDMLAPCLESTT